MVEWGIARQVQFPQFDHSSGILNVVADVWLESPLQELPLNGRAVGLCCPATEIFYVKT